MTQWRIRPSKQLGIAVSREARPGAAGSSAALSEGGGSGVGHLDPLRIGCSLGVVIVVPIPPFVRRALRVTLRRVLPGLLTPERRDIQVAPRRAHRLVAAAVDEVGAEDLAAVAEEHVMAMPLVHAKVEVEAIRQGIPGHFP